MKMNLERSLIDGKDGRLLSFQCDVMCLGKLILGKACDKVGFSYFLWSLIWTNHIQKRHRNKFSEYHRACLNQLTSCYGIMLLI